MTNLTFGSLTLPEARREAKSKAIAWGGRWAIFYNTDGKTFSVFGDEAIRKARARGLSPILMCMYALGSAVEWWRYESREED